MTEAGWTTGRAARAIAELMARLGYERYGVHGGDIGAGVGSGLTSADPDRVLALHVTSGYETAAKTPRRVVSRMATAESAALTSFRMRVLLQR